MTDHEEFIAATEEDAYLALMDSLGIRITPAGPEVPEVW